MATSPSEPSPKHVKLRYRALAYVRRIGRHRQPAQPRATSRRSFIDTSGARPHVRLSDADGVTNKMGLPDSNGLRPVVRISSKRSFGDSGGARPAGRIGSRKSGVDSAGSKSVTTLDARRSNLDSNEAVFTTGEIKANKRTRRARKKSRKARDQGGNRRHRFFSLFHDHDGPQYRLFGGCCVKQEAFDPAETPSFHWGVGFDDRYYHTPSYQPLSKGTKFRLQLCGFHITSRGDPVGHSADSSSIGARAASFDSGFGFTCASPVSCPLPFGLVPTRTLPTMLRLRSRDGTGSGKFTLNTGNSGFSSTGIKRKAPSPSSGYLSYTPTTPPSPFLNDFTVAGTFNKTRVRSRVSVGCNGWFLNDDDPANMNWYRRYSGEVKPKASETGFDGGSPKRYKRSPRGESLSLVEDFHSSSTNSRNSRISIVFLSQNGSVSSSKGDHGWLGSSGIALVPLPSSSPPSTSRHLYTTAPSSLFVACQDSSQTYDSGGMRQGDSENDDYAPLTKRRRSIASSSNSSGGFGFKNLPRCSMNQVERESLNIERSLSARASTSLTARFSASLRLTRSLSSRTLKRALSPGLRHREGRRSCSHSASRSRSRRMFHLGHSTSIPKTSSPPLAPVKTVPNPSIVFIDC